MLSEIRLQNFRGFRDLSITPLGRVNLVVSRGNVGKTSVLEGLLLLLTGEAGLSSFPRRFRNVGANEGEEFWSWLFRDKEMDSTITLSGVLAGHGRNRKSREIRLEVTSRDSQRQAVPDGTAYESVYHFATRNESRSISIKRVPHSAPGKAVDGEGPWGEIGPDTVVFSVQPADLQKETEKYDRVLRKRGGEEKVQSLLKIIEPRLTKIRTGLTGPRGQNSTSIFADIGLKEMIPVTQLGQGFCRVLSIYTSILLSEARVVLIDEIENGIHYTALEQFWNGMAEAAKLEDVQVFATTHSWECLRAARKVFDGSRREDLAVHALRREGDNVRAKEYDSEAFAAAVDQGIEIR